MQSSEKIFSQTEADRPEYKAHKVFKELDRAIEFYDLLDFSVMGFATAGTKSIINIDSLLYSSIKNTLESIKIILEKGHIGDAFCLLRKYYDSCLLNLYTNVYLENNKNEANFLINDVVHWMDGTKKLPHDTFKTMRQYLLKFQKSKEILDLVFQDQNYELTRQRCNDHTHYNYFDNVLVNDNQLHFVDRIDQLNRLQNDLENIFVLHVSCIFHINDHYMMSSDYMDSLEFGVKPEEGSQYWVADFIQDIFNDVIKIKRPEIVEFIKKNTAMKLS